MMKKRTRGQTFLSQHNPYRQYRTRVKEGALDMLPINFGAQQGSFLGPLLNLVYRRALQTLSNNTKCTSAYNTVILTSHSDVL